MLLNPTNLCNQNSTKNFLQRVFIAESLIYACYLLLLNAICFNPINLIIYLWTWYLKLASRFSVKWVEEYEKLDFPTYFNREGEEKNTGTIPLVSLLPMVKMRIKEWTQFFFQEPLSFMETTSQKSARMSNYHWVRNSAAAGNWKELPLQILFAILLMGLSPASWQCVTLLLIYHRSINRRLYPWKTGICPGLSSQSEGRVTSESQIIILSGKYVRVVFASLEAEKE